MKLKSIKVKNFRCLKDISISFEPDITVIVGENDSGKSSLVKVIDLAMKNAMPDPSDFFAGERSMRWELDFSKESYIFEFKMNDENIERVIKKTVSWGILRPYLAEQYKINDLNQEEIKNLLAQFGKTTQKRSLDPLRQQLVELLEDNKNKIKNNDKEEVPIKEMPQLLTVPPLDGKTFEDINGFLKDIYLKEAIKNIWSVKVEGTNEKLETIFETNLNKIADEKQKEINQEVLPRIREFLPDVQEILIDIEHQPFDITRTINVATSFRDVEGKEIQFAKKGDGTKRRTTLALLRHKVEKERGMEQKVFIFDEPDTHLHVKAQRELMEILDQIKREAQVIITTHSPFILNSIEPSKIRMLCLENGATNVKYLEDNNDVKDLLKSLGIENTHLFFTRKILLVEGESEEIALPILFKKYKKKSLDSELVTLINAHGVDNLAQLAKVLIELMADIPLMVLVDQDIDRDSVIKRRKNTKELLEKLQKERRVDKFKIGYMEFEDAFDSDVIYESVKRYYSDQVKERWCIEEIEKCKEKLKENPCYQFAEALEKLSNRKKTEIAKAIANYCDINQIPQDLIALFDAIKPTEDIIPTENVNP